MAAKKVLATVAVALALVAAVVLIHEQNVRQRPVATSLSSSPVCTQDTGSACGPGTLDGGLFGGKCMPWRKASCQNSKCMCPEGQCAHLGTCLPKSEVLEWQERQSPPPQKCETKIGGFWGTCKLLPCRNGKCSGVTLGFSPSPDWVNLGTCLCDKEGECAVNGQCVASPELTKPPKTLNRDRIVCPVLAGLYEMGILVPDEYGRVERLEVQRAMQVGLNMDLSTAFFFGQFTAGYTKADVDSTNFMMYPLSAGFKEMNEGYGGVDANATMMTPPSGARYLNIFTMGSNKDVLHQIAGATRGGKGLIDPECSGYPCKSRFEAFFAKFADSTGRVYQRQLGEIACNIYKNGFHGVAAAETLFLISPGFTGREFLALQGFIFAFGKQDADGETYLDVKDMETMLMDGVFPKDWKMPRVWGFKDAFPHFNTWKDQGVCGLTDQELLAAGSSSSEGILSQLLDIVKYRMSQV